MKTLLAALAFVLASAAGMAQADTLKKILDSGSVTMGVRESSGALSYTLGDGKFVGYHVEICQRVLEDIRKQLGLASLDLKFQPVTSQNRIPLLRNGTVDIECGSTTHNLAREQDVAFALTTFVEEVRVAVRADSGIAYITQLGGKTVAVTTGTTSVQTLRQHQRAGGIAFEQVFGKDHADSFLLLESGRADAFVMDGAILAGLIARSKNPAGFSLLAEVLSVEPIAIMLRRDDPGFKQAVDASLRAMMKSGEVARLWEQWFMQPIPPAASRVGLPPNQATRAAWARPNDRPMEALLATATATASESASAGRWDWQVFCKDTLDGAVQPGCFGRGGDITYLDWMLSAWSWTLAVSALALIVALAVGTLMGILRTVPDPRLQFLGHAWTELFRNIPLLVQIFLWYHVIPGVFPVLRELPSFVLVVLGLGFFTSARIAEQVKAGIQSLPRGQTHAGLAVGFTLAQTYRHVLLPMALRIVIPPITSESMNIVKNSSVAFAVSITELTLFAMQAQEETSRGVEIYLAVTGLYFVSAFAVNRVMLWVEARLRVPGMVGAGA